MTGLLDDRLVLGDIFQKRFPGNITYHWRIFNDRSFVMSFLITILNKTYSLKKSRNCAGISNFLISSLIFVPQYEEPVSPKIFYLSLKDNPTLSYLEKQSSFLSSIYFPSCNCDSSHSWFKSRIMHTLLR